MIRRREFVALIGGAAAAWPLAVSAQQPSMPVVGFLHAGVPNQIVLAPFREGLSQAGFVEGRNVVVEFRWAQDDNSRLPELAADLVRRGVAVIVTPGTTPAALAAKAATSIIPIVFYVGTDPVQIGLVASLSRPGANVTGISSMSSELAGKWLGLLHELLPAATRFAILVNPANRIADALAAEAREAAAAKAWQMEIVTARNSGEIDDVFASLVEKRIDALLVGQDVTVLTRRVQLATLAAHHHLPTIYPNRENVEVGGLLSYGTKVSDLYRQTGIYVGRVLKGEKPADLPVLRPTQFELVINLQTAKTLGLTVPATLLSLANEVIE